MRFLAVAALFYCGLAFAQKPCDFSVNVTDSTGTYKATKEVLLYEKNFAGHASYMFASIAVTDGLPTLNLQLLEKSQEFIKARCFDAGSKLYLQLENGKIVTLLHLPKESCGSMVRDDNGFNNRILTGHFLFKKDDADFLKTSPISLLRIKFATEATDYIMRPAFKAEIDNQLYQPASYFVDYYHCINASK
ncbi:hypothetical protein [Flavobacterium caeni]|uniref:Tissue inhibitor of metalloproteinase n=1 Tax=Flavobacterium caeni TaxID=490189 RepID=A0A1G5DDN7_9FLAO|nr:hypothetical protein [Flavobacterium caeni]SCY12641.1 hypothetical protein SAMN02927903_00824 [Flavobacterium caeni]